MVRTPKTDAPMSHAPNSHAPNCRAPEPFVIAQPEPRRPSGRAILLAGVAGACAMGVGLGLWARPGLHERQMAQAAHVEAPAVAPAAGHRLEIVVSDRPRTIGAPIEVLPTGVAARAPEAPRLAPSPTAPTRPPEGLMKTRDEAPPAAEPARASSLKAVLPQLAAAFAGARLVLTRLEHPAPAADAPAPKLEHPAELARAHARQLQIARADAARAEAHRAALAKAEFEQAKAAEAQAHAAQLAKAQAHRLLLAKAEAARLQARAEAHRQAVARADTARAGAAKAAARKLELAHAAKAEKAEQLKLAKAEARAKAAQHEEARLEKLAEAAEAKKRTQLARLAHALARAVSGREAAPAVETVKLDRKHGRHDAKVQQAVSRRRHEPGARMVSAHAGRARPEPLAPPPSGLMKVSTSPRCASRDPGEALTCADPALSAAERQVSRAFQGARAAGVPDAQLQLGQQRWLAARSAAAREAPWALRDVYMARIAELNGQAKEAQGGY